MYSRARGGGGREDGKLRHVGVAADPLEGPVIPQKLGESEQVDCSVHIFRMWR
jgi:hypothetical protein